MEVDDAGAAMRFSAEVERVKGSGMLGRSDPLNRLFAYLAERSGAVEAPKEIDIALEVFGRTDTFDVSQDASVRVYIHRLRGKLDSFYDGAAEASDRLLIPRGEYRLVLQGGTKPAALPAVTAEQQLPAVPYEAPVPTSPTTKRRWRGLLAGALLLAMAAAGGAGYLVGRQADSAPLEIANTSVWAPILKSPRMTFVVLGDYYIFGETSGSFDVQRLVREFAINSPADLDQYIMSHPERSLRVADLDLHYLPLSAAPALGNILPAMTDRRRSGVGRAGVTTISQIAPDVVKTSNVVYVGYLSGLGLLRDILFPISSFSIGATYDEIVDRRTGRRYTAQWSSSARNARTHLDYGYLASLNGPTGNRIIIVSGTRDAGVVQASEAAINPALLRDLANKAGSDSFEVLYEVRTIGHVNVGSRPVAIRPLSPSGGVLPIPGGDAERFPDDVRKAP